MLERKIGCKIRRSLNMDAPLLFVVTKSSGPGEADMTDDFIEGNCIWFWFCFLFHFKSGMENNENVANAFYHFM